MKIYKSVTIDIETLEILSEDSYEYEGPIALAYGGQGEGSPGGGGMSSPDVGGGTDYQSIQNDWIGINADIAQALSGTAPTGDTGGNQLSGGYVASAPNVGNTEAINWQSHVGPDPGSYNDAGAATGFQNNIGSMLGAGGNKMGFDKSNAWNIAKAASTFLGPIGGLLAGIMGGIMTGTEYGGYLKANPDGSVGLTSEIPGLSFDDGSEAFFGGKGTGGEATSPSDGFSGYSGFGGGQSAGGVSGDDEGGYGPQGSGPTRGDFERYAYKNSFADDDLARSLVFGEGEFTKSLF